jgi:hypothetical protein
MRADIFTACHSAIANKDGTFTIDKAFCSLVIPGPLPRKLHGINVAIRLIFDEDEAGDHVLTLKTTDMDGQCLGQGQASISIPQDEDPRNRIFLCVIDLEVFEAKTYGEYRVDLLVDQQEKAHFLMFLKEFPNQLPAL